MFPLACVAAAPARAVEPEAYVVADAVSYSGWDSGSRPMNALWTGGSGAAPTVGVVYPLPSDPLADPDRDGRVSLLEYACGSDPTRADALDSMLSLRSGGHDSDYVFTYRRLLAPGPVTFVVETSPDLAGWTASILSPDSISSTSAVDGRTEIVSVHLPVAPGSDRLFARLRVDASLSDDTCFTLNNGVVWAPLSRVLHTDFELSLDACHADFQRFLWAALLNADGTKGYGVFWDSATPAQSGSAGNVGVRKFTLSAPAAFTDAGVLLGDSVPSGHAPANPFGAAVSPPFATLRLVWGRDQGVLKLYVDGVLRQTVYDAEFTSFARLYVAGNGGARFDNIEVVVPAGASVPFVTREAEDWLNTTSGTVVAMDTAPSADTSTPELEASGRAFVQLSSTGQQLTVSDAPATTGIVIRHCIPDAPGGGGVNATLNLYVNGVFRQSLGLSSRHNWLYGAADQAWTNSPASGPARLFWDETAFFVSGGINAGDTVMLRKDAGNTAAFYRIDLIDFENVPAPLAAPAAGTYYSVTDYGANGADENDDTSAFLACIAAAKSGGKTVWIPAGTYRQIARFTLDGVVVQGAGLWHTRIVGMTEGSDWHGTMGFELVGNGPRVSDLALDGYAHTSRNFGGKPFTGAPVHWAVENVWITHTNVGFWMSGARNGVVRGCRVRNTYADGINLGRGSVGNLVEHNHVRGCGDDGIAILSETEHAPSADNVVRLNTVRAIWWGQNASLDGGSSNVFEWNCLADNARMAAFTINLSGAWPSHPVVGALIRRNLIVRGGGNHAGQRRGAIWTYAAGNPLGNVWVQDNYIKDPVFKGVHLTGPQSQQLIFERNHIENPGEGGVVIAGECTGWAVFTGNTLAGLPAGGTAFINHAGAAFSTAHTDNDF